MTSYSKYYSVRVGYKKDRAKKQEIINALKNKGCIICGYNKCLPALAMHHIKPSEKTIVADKMKRLGWDKFYEELKKCIVVCHNCHTEIHNGLHPEYLDDSGDKMYNIEELSHNMELSFMTRQSE